VNVLNLESISKSFDIRPLLDGVSLGVSENQRIGVVGRNGDGKSTLLKIMAGLIEPDSGRVAKANSVRIGILSQADTAPSGASVREVVLGDIPVHEWASNSRIREVLAGLFGGHSDELLDRDFHSLSGGERRRVNLAKLLVDDLELILLDEPTNHLDVEGVAWLAAHLRARATLSVVVITHDRWFLDEISDQIWEVVDGKVLEYEGGYSAYVLSKAERSRQSRVESGKRDMLIRKELAWLRRGAPARTAKPKFRIEAANQLIANEPPVRNQAELLNFASNRLGNTVYELHQASIHAGELELLDQIYWNIGPGNRVAIVGVNGAGKTTLMRTLAGDHKISAGKLVTGVTVKSVFLSQHLEELDPTWRVLEAVEKVANRIELGNGRELSASQLCERLGFNKDQQWTPVRDLSGGERRRLQLTRLLMQSPNVLLLDEPTNDFDVETLTALEDLLDSFAGTLLVISHDRYFLERVCDTFVGLVGDKLLRDLPRGIEEYLEIRKLSASGSKASNSSKSAAVSATKELSIVEQKAAKKEIARIEKQLERRVIRIKEIEELLDVVATDHTKLIELHAELENLRLEHAELELAWLELNVS
jgi:ATP-binding cassette subfamily F protein uup